MNDVNNPVLTEHKIAKLLFDAGLGKHRGVYIVRTGLNWVDVVEIAEEAPQRGSSECQGKDTLL